MLIFDIPRDETTSIIISDGEKHICKIFFGKSRGRKRMMLEFRDKDVQCVKKKRPINGNLIKKFNENNPVETM